MAERSDDMEKKSVKMKKTPTCVGAFSVLNHFKNYTDSV